MTDAPAPRDPLDQNFVPVCSIGASAGGVTALQNLLRQLPPDLGLAYVVVVHLSPEEPSALGDILSICTRMPVTQVQKDAILKRDAVYVISPDRELVIEGDSVTARAFSEPRGHRAPIDMFFRSVAAARGDGVAVILSGAGADGSVGVRAVKEAGGVIMVQEPAEAGFPSMPQSAIATGAADFVAPIARLAERLAEVARSKEAVRSLDMDGAANDLRRIVSFLRSRTGHDFSSYKRATVMRRVIRRMQVCRTNTLGQYAEHLLSTPEEAKELLADLLISVTMFFRDPRSFEALERHAIKPLFDDLDPEKDEGIRVWTVGCATGEEAYGVAMLLYEEASRRKISVEVQIFATDLDDDALATARAGRFPRTIEADVSEERLARFFIDEGSHYRVRKELRDSVLFASHSVIKEPPFMRLDLITCRNLLIYLERALQAQLCSIFHYGLKRGRFLFLGSAETADAAIELFSPVDREARIYAARPYTPHAAPTLPQFAARERFGQALPAQASRSERAEAPAALHASSLERSAPASALVDGGQNVLHLSPSAGRFILHSAGPVSSQLSTIVRPELRLDLGVALARALDRKEPTLTHPTIVDFDGERRRVVMSVAPAEHDEQALVFFLDGGPIVEIEAPEAEPGDQSDEVRRLNAELKSAQEAVVASRRGHEAAMQDLRATNEELQSINEEYRSTAEELETSKEELQSINEELHTVNAELKSKLSSISIAHSDLQNLTATTEIGTLFLDGDLRIRMFTPPIAELFPITRYDIGRAITSFTHQLEYSGFEDDVDRVLENLTPIEHEVRSRTGRWYTLRLHPYRTIDDRIDGAVLTFVDVTARRTMEVAQRESEERLQAFVTASSAVTYRMSADWSEMRHLDGRGFLVDAGKSTDHWADIYIPEQDRPEVFAAIEQAVSGKRMFELEHKVRLADGRVGWVLSRAVPMLTKDGSISEWFGAASDVSVRKAAEEALLGSEARQAFLLKLSDTLRPLADPVEIANNACRLLVDHLNGSRAQYAGLSGAPGEEMGEIRGEHVGVGGPMPRRFSLAAFGEPILKILRAGQSLVMPDAARDPRLGEEQRAAFLAVEAPSTISVPLVKGGRWIAVLTVHGSAARDWSASDVALVEDVADRTWAALERARAEAALRDSEALRRVAIAGGGMGTWRWDLKERLIWGDAKFLALWGFPPSDEAVPLSAFTERMTADGAREMEAIVTRAIEADEEFDGQLEIVSGPATGRWIRWRGRADSDLASILFGVTFDITEQRRAENALRESEGRFQQFAEASSDVLWIRNADDLRFEFVSRAFEKVYGLDRERVTDTGEIVHWIDLIDAEDRSLMLDMMKKVKAGERVQFEFRVERPDGEIRWVQNTDFPLLDASGHVQRIGGIAHDVTDEKSTAARMEVLVAELQHRTRNLLGVVRVLMDQSLSEKATLEEVRESIHARLGALGRVNGLLSRLKDGDRIAFDELIETEVTAVGGRNKDVQVTLEGPRGIRLRSATVQTLALALHELATNAVKYGALSDPNGRLSVTWRSTREAGKKRWLHIDWRESGVTVDVSSAPTSGGGYGRQLIEEALPYQLGAQVDYKLTPQGLVCAISLPISEAR